MYTRSWRHAIGVVVCYIKKKRVIAPPLWVRPIREWLHLFVIWLAHKCMSAWNKRLIAPSWGGVRVWCWRWRGRRKCCGEFSPRLASSLIILFTEWVSFGVKRETRTWISFLLLALPLLRVLIVFVLCWCSASLVFVYILAMYEMYSEWNR